jgi:cobalt-zinc-cadmium efflux system protein
MVTPSSPNTKSPQADDGVKTRLFQTRPGHAHGPGGAHGHSQSHSHGGGHGHTASENIRFAFILNFGFSIVEMVGGIWIGSLAISANAIHDFGDSVSLAVAWFLERIANRRQDRSFNFGYRRFSLLSALISGVVIAAGNGVILYECVHRMVNMGEQTAPSGPAMIALALIGLGMNAWAAFRLSLGQTKSERMLTWHLIEDVLGWAIVLIGGIIIRFTAAVWLDPILAGALALFVTFRILGHLRGTAVLFLQGRPENFDEEAFVAATMGIAGVERIDHLAVWSLDGETSILSARLHLHSTHNPVEIEKIKAQVRALALEQKAEATLETCLSAHGSDADSGRAVGCEHDEIDSTPHLPKG